MIRKFLGQGWPYLLVAGLVAACSSSTTIETDDCADCDGGDGDAASSEKSDGATKLDASASVDAQAMVDAHDNVDGSHVTLDAGHDAHDSAVSDSSVTPIDAADAGCSNPGAPALHFRAMAGVFCPFGGPAGAPIVCGASEECCEPPVASGVASNCQAGATSCGTIGSAVWGCEETLDCNGGKVCCAAGTVAFDPVCGFMRGSVTLAASACATSCGGGELHLCASQAECGGGTICTPFKVKGLELGACL